MTRFQNLLFVIFVIALCHGESDDAVRIRQLLRLVAKAKTTAERLLASGTACPYQPIPVPLPEPLPEGITDALSSLGSMLETMRVHDSTAPGLAAAVTYGDQVVWMFGSGTRNVSQPNNTPDENTIFRIGSVTKALTALVLYQLFEQNKVSLDDAVQRHAAGFSMLDPFHSPPGTVPTFRQLASHLGGVPREAPCSNVACNFTSAQMFERLASESLISPPWEYPSYSNLGFSLLGRVLSEFVAGMEYEDYVQKYILGPLGMKNTGFWYTPEVVAQMAVGYYPDGSTAPLYDWGWGAPCAQAYSTVADLAKIMIALNMAHSGQDSAILRANTAKEMLQSLFVNADGTSGFATPWENSFQNAYTVRTKGGNVDGYSALISMVPELTLGVTILWNSGADETAWSVAVQNLLIPAFVNSLASLQPPVPLPPAVDNFAGIYRAGSATAQVLLQNNHLILVVEGLSMYLWWLHDATFKIYIPRELQACMFTEMLAFDNQLVPFTLNDKDVANSFTIPGLIWGVTFSR